MKNPLKRWANWRRLKKLVKADDAERAAFRAKVAALSPTERLASINVQLDRLLTLAGTKDPKLAPVRYQRAAPPPGVVPAMAMDAVLACDTTDYGWLNQGNFDFQYSFQGYQYLALLAQVPEHRKIIGRLSTEMTRNFVKLVAVGEGDFTDEIAALEEDLRTFRLQAHFKKLSDIAGFMGRAQLYVDVKTPSGVVAYDVPAELEKKLFLHPKKLSKDCLRGFRVVEPMWSYPGVYNSVDPLKPGYYDPQEWYVMGKKVHVSRLLTLIPHPVPDVLKAVYAFGGVSMAQMAEPYINNWLRARQAVSDIMTNFSISGLKTDLSAVLEAPFDDGLGGVGLEPAGDVLKRVQLASQLKNNRNYFVIDKETEDFFQFNTPLGTLDKLQAQAQEQMASVGNMPLVVLTGVTPAGLNASSDGEIRVWYDYVNSEKEQQYSGIFDIVLKVLQLNRFGRLIPEITFEWPALYQLSDDQKAAMRKTQADTDAVYINAGVFSPDEIRVARVSEDGGAYNSIKETGNEDADEETDHEETSSENEGEPSNRTDTRAATGR